MILERSCELAVLARELGDRDLVKRFEACAHRAAPVVGASRSLVARMGRSIKL
jgi:hypothetical protein